MFRLFWLEVNILGLELNPLLKTGLDLKLTGGGLLETKGTTVGEDLNDEADDCC